MTEPRLVDGFGVTKEWVEETMSKEFNDKASVIKVDVLNVCGYMSAIARVHLSWKTENDKFPKSVVAKLPSGLAAEEAWKKCGHMEDGQEAPPDPIHEHMHNTEIKVYSLFKKAPSAELRSPRLYGSRPMNSFPVLLMEDISNSFHVDLVEGFTEKQLYPVMDQIIALAKWSSKNTDLWQDVNFDMKFDPDGENFTGSIVKMMDSMAKDDPRLEKPFEMLKKNFAHDPKWIKRQMEELNDSGKAVFVHGDLWAPQILWRGDKIASIVDWALCRPGPRTEDILRVLTTCCTTEVRRKMTEPLLEYYAEHIGGEITLEQLKEDYRNALPASCTMMCFAVCMWSHSPVLRHGKDDDEERVRHMRDRLIATIEDTAEILGWN